MTKEYDISQSAVEWWDKRIKAGKMVVDAISYGMAGMSGHEIGCIRLLVGGKPMIGITEVCQHDPAGARFTLVAVLPPEGEEIVILDSEGNPTEHKFDLPSYDDEPVQ